MKYTILSVLKERLNKPNESYEVSESGREYSLRQFRFKNLQDNLYEPMSEKTEFEYRNGSGNELDGNMKSIHSSSAMTYNIFRNENAIFNRIEYEVTYEKQFYTLKEGATGKPANIDAFLVSKDGTNIVACEMKMTEWLTDKKLIIKQAYLEKENYQIESSADAFLEVLDNFSCEFGKSAPYDAMQMFKHALALYNACASGEISPKKLDLISCVWDVPFLSELRESEYDKCWFKRRRSIVWYGKFYKAIYPIKKAFLDLGVEFELKYYNPLEFVVEMTLSDEVREYLRRYTK